MEPNNDKLFELIAKYFTGESTEGEKHLIEEWREINEENKQEFERMKKIMDHKEESLSPNIEQALKSVMQKLPEQKKPIRFQWKTAFRVAAVFLIAFLLGYSGFKIYLHSTYRMIAYTQTSDTNSSLLLPDGTEVWLRKNAKIQYPNRFMGKTRQVEFEGEAFFKVYHDAERPFYIHTARSVTSVLGTRFLLRSNTPDSLVVLIVEEGKVMFSGKDVKTADSKKLVVAGEKAVLNERTNAVSLKLNDESNYQSWRTKKLIFYQTRLINVLRDLENFYNIKFDSIPAGLGDSLLTGVYNDLSLNQTLENLQLTLPITIEKIGEMYQIKPHS